MSTRLHLRLWAQPHCSRVVGKIVLLEHHGLDGVVLCIDAAGIACVVCDAHRAPTPEGLAPAADGLPAEPWPVLQLCRQAGGGATWSKWSVGAASGTEVTPDVAKQLAAPEGRPTLTEAGRRLIVGAIEGYYQQHVLEPSVAGFLSILEKQVCPPVALTPRRPAAGPESSRAASDYQRPRRPCAPPER
jgi:hypothetical protein